MWPPRPNCGRPTGTLRRGFSHRPPAGTLDGILVQKQVQGVELLMGLKRDPQFGPVLVAGAGGIYTEVLKDVARALVPITADQAADLLQSLKIYPILQGVRGQAGVEPPPWPRPWSTCPGWRWITRKSRNWTSTPWWPTPRAAGAWIAG